MNTKVFPGGGGGKVESLLGLQDAFDKDVGFAESGKFPGHGHRNPTVVVSLDAFGEFFAQSGI